MKSIEALERRVLKKARCPFLSRLTDGVLQSLMCRGKRMLRDLDKLTNLAGIAICVEARREIGIRKGIRHVERRQGDARQAVHSPLAGEMGREGKAVRAILVSVDYADLQRS